jgi:hypothetical protein
MGVRSVMNDIILIYDYDDKRFSTRKPMHISNADMHLNFGNDCPVVVGGGIIQQFHYQLEVGKKRF